MDDRHPPPLQSRSRYETSPAFHSVPNPSRQARDGVPVGRESFRRRSAEPGCRPEAHGKENDIAGARLELRVK